MSKTNNSLCTLWLTVAVHSTWGLKEWTILFMMKFWARSSERLHTGSPHPDLYYCPTSTLPPVAVNNIIIAVFARLKIYLIYILNCQSLTLCTLPVQCRITVHFATTAFWINSTNLALDITFDPPLSRVSAGCCRQIIAGAHYTQDVHLIQNWSHQPIYSGSKEIRSPQFHWHLKKHLKFK